MSRDEKLVGGFTYVLDTLASDAEQGTEASEWHLMYLLSQTASDGEAYAQIERVLSFLRTGDRGDRLGAEFILRNLVIRFGGEEYNPEHVREEGWDERER